MADMRGAPSRQELEDMYAWDPADKVSGRPEMTAFRQRLRLHQSRWRAEQGHPMGTQPIVPRAGRAARPVGSRLPLSYAHETGANFLTAGALAAARARTSAVEPYQTLDRQRLWADLLWSPTMAINLFGDLATDLELADQAVHGWWPDAPGTVCDVRFAHSPGRLDPEYIGSLRAFEAAFVLDLGDGTRGILGVDTKYHEWAKPETPRPENLPRYLEVAQRSGIFRPSAVDAVKGKTPFAVMWLEHLLLLSMLQHASGAWRWGRYVVVHPADNRDVSDLCGRYRELLADGSTFSSLSLETVLDAGAIPAPTVAQLRKRYMCREEE